MNTPTLDPKFKNAIAKIFCVSWAKPSYQFVSELSQALYQLKTPRMRLVFGFPQFAKPFQNRDGPRLIAKYQQLFKRHSVTFILT